MHAPNPARLFKPPPQTFFAHSVEAWLTPFPTVQLFHYGNVILNPQKGPKALVENTENTLTLRTTPIHPPTGATKAKILPYNEVAGVCCTSPLNHRKGGGGRGFQISVLISSISKNKTTTGPDFRSWRWLIQEAPFQIWFHGMCAGWVRGNTRVPGWCCGLLTLFTVSQHGIWNLYTR